MKRRYKLPIQGKVLARTPLKGDDADPISIIPIKDLPNRPAQEGCSLVCLNYDVDEEWCEVEIEASESFHNWLTDMLPQLQTIKKEKGWKLDKSRLEEK